jgi:hypothetical protein
MIRREEINNAKEAFYERIIKEGSYYDPRDCFEEGAEWADANPKNPWISVEDDLPCNHKELMENEYKTKKVLVVMRSDKSSSKNIEICYMTNQYSSIGNWYWINTLKTHVTHWMPLPELPKNR